MKVSSEFHFPYLKKNAINNALDLQISEENIEEPFDKKNGVMKIISYSALAIGLAVMAIKKGKKIKIKDLTRNYQSNEDVLSHNVPIYHQRLAQKGERTVVKAPVMKKSKKITNSCLNTSEKQTSAEMVTSKIGNIQEQSASLKTIKPVEAESTWFRGNIKLSQEQEKDCSLKYFGEYCADGIRRGGTSMGTASEKIENFIQKYTNKDIPINIKTYKTLQELEEIQFLINKFFPELKDSNFDINTKLLLLKEVFKANNKIGIQRTDYFHFLPERYVPAFKIGDMATVINEGKISATDKEELIKMSTQIAKKLGNAYEENLRLQLETGKYYNIYQKKEDKYIPYNIFQKPKPFTDAEEKIVYGYIECGVDNPFGFGGAFSINHALRYSPHNLKNPQGKAFIGIKEEIVNLDKMMQNQTPLDSNYTVFRMLGAGSQECDDFISKYKKVGNIVTDNGYVSTTTSMEAGSEAYSSLFGDVPGTSYVMRINLPKGTKGIDMRRCNGLYHGFNAEFMLPRNSKFKITAYDDKTKIINAEYILPE